MYLCGWNRMGIRGPLLTMRIPSDVLVVEDHEYVNIIEKRNLLPSWVLKINILVPFPLPYIHEYTNAIYSNTTSRTDLIKRGTDRHSFYTGITLCGNRSLTVTGDPESHQKPVVGHFFTSRVRMLSLLDLRRLLVCSPYHLEKD